MLLIAKCSLSMQSLNNHKYINHSIFFHYIYIDGVYLCVCFLVLMHVSQQMLYYVKCTLGTLV